MDSSHANADGSANKILSEIATATEAFTRNDPSAREKLLLLSYQLTSALEHPSETIERIGWAEVNFTLIHGCFNS